VNVARDQPLHVGVALLASAEAYTPTAQRLIDGARERLGSVADVANGLADNLPQAKQPSGKSRRRRRRKKRQADAARPEARAAVAGGGDGARPDAETAPVGEAAQRAAASA
jgi:hypothetical protein